MIEFSEHEATIVEFDTDIKVSGEPDPLPTAVIGISLNMRSELLAMFDPVLRSLLFHKNGAVQHDLASVTHDAPDVRFPKLDTPYTWNEAIDGATLTIHIGVGGEGKGPTKSADIVIPEASVKNFKLTPMEGGTVVVSFTVRAKSENRKVFSELPYMLKTSRRVSLVQPPPPADEE